MRILRNMCYVLIGIIKLSVIKLIRWNRMSFQLIPRIPISTCITVGDKGSLLFGKNFRTERFSKISVLKNGFLNIGDNVSFGENNKIICHDNIKIGSGTIMGPNVCIYDHDHIFTKDNGVDRVAYKTSPIEIGENCWICASAVILRGTVIGNNCVIGAGAIVKGVIPSGTKVIQKREMDMRGDDNEYNNCN